MTTSGYIYVYINPKSQFNNLKIVITTRTPDERFGEFSDGFGIPINFVLAYEEPVSDIELAKKLLHQKLNKYQTDEINGFFSLSFKDAIPIVNQVSESIRDSYGEGQLNDDQLRQMKQNGLKIEAIKYARENRGLSLRSAVKYIDDL